MAQTVAVESQDTLQSVLARIQDSEEVVITREGHPIARIIPDKTPVDPKQVDAAISRLRGYFADAGPFDLAEFKRDRDTGRR